VRAHDRGQVGEERGHFGGQARRAQVGTHRPSRAGASRNGQERARGQGKSELAVEERAPCPEAAVAGRTRLRPQFNLPFAMLAGVSFLAIARAAAPQACTMNSAVLVCRRALSPTLFPPVPTPHPSAITSASTAVPRVAHTPVAHLALRKRAPLNWPGPAHTPGR
jgi:hypothetical protein